MVDYTPANWQPRDRAEAVRMRAELIADKAFYELLAAGNRDANRIMRQVTEGVVGTEQNWQPGTLSKEELAIRGDGIA